MTAGLDINGVDAPRDHADKQLAPGGTAPHNIGQVADV
jgi:hypothetical protein